MPGNVLTLLLKISSNVLIKPFKGRMISKSKNSISSKFKDSYNKCGRFELVHVMTSGAIVITRVFWFI